MNEAPKGQVIIVPGYLLNQLYAYWLDQAETNAVFNVEFKSFSQLLKEENIKVESDLQILLKVYDGLTLQCGQYPLLGKEFKFPAFISDILDFYQELVFYEVAINDLPEQQPVEKELKKLCEYLDTLDLPYRSELKYLKSLDCHNYEVLTNFQGNYRDHYFAQYFIEHGAKTFELKTYDKPKISYYQGTNAEEEVNGLADYIISKDLPLDQIQIVLNQNDYAYLIKRVFTAKGIPFRGANYSSGSMIRKLKKITTFLLLPISQNLSAMFTENCFGINTLRLGEYLSMFELGLNDCFEPFDHLTSIEQNLWDKHSFANLKELENNAERLRVELLPVFTYLKNNDIVALYNYLLNDPLIKAHDKQETQLFSKARELVSTLSNNISLLDHQLGLLPSIEEESEYQAISIVTATTLLPSKTLTVILGTNENDFFPSIAKQGILSETYLKKLKSYPSLTKRLAHQNELMMQFKTISPEILVSFSCSDLSGKSRQFSSLIADLYEETKFILWPKNKHSVTQNNQPKIEPETAKKLFLTDSVLTGSISSLSLVNLCPFSYFLKQGLKIDTWSTYPEIDFALLGTIRHAIMEEYAGKEVPTLSQLQQQLSPYLKQLSDTYPQQEKLLRFVFKQLADQLLLKLQLSSEMLKDSLLQPSIKEERFPLTIKLKPYDLKLSGIIDRVDTSKDYFRIIDYKSSKHPFSKALFENGKDLQVVTYALMAKEKLTQEPLGVYYFSLKTEKIKLSLNDQNDPEINYQKYLKDNRLNGGQFEVVNSEKLNSDVYLNSDKLDYLQSKEVLTDLYQQIEDLILKGEYAITPDQKACRYCDFKGICHHEETEEENGTDPTTSTGD
jgi:ATP-dependent helicase/DNAse subunit B